MKNVFLKTFGGLTVSYLIRQYFFAILLGFVFIGFLSAAGTQETGTVLKTPLIAFVVVSIILYPYARYVFDSVIGFIMGGTVFLLPIPVMFMIKFMNIAICFSFAVFMAPVGLIYLYFYHSKQEKISQAEQ